MKTGRNKGAYIPFVCLMILWIALLHIPMLSYGTEITVSIDIAPATLNIQSNDVIVTVHTDIPYNNVEFLSVYLGGVAIKCWKSDDCGYYAAKFSMDEIKTLNGLTIGDYNTLTLLGVTTDGKSFLRTDNIKVIDNSPSGK